MNQSWRKGDFKIELGNRATRDPRDISSFGKARAVKQLFSTTLLLWMDLWLQFPHGITSNLVETDSHQSQPCLKRQIAARKVRMSIRVHAQLNFASSLRAPVEGEDREKQKITGSEGEVQAQVPHIDTLVEDRSTALILRMTQVHTTIPIHLTPEARSI